MLGTPTVAVTPEWLSMRVECSATVELSATGRGRADWTRVRRRSFRLPDRSQPTDSALFDRSYLAFLSLDSISATKPDTAVLRASGNHPFSVEYTLWYLVRGGAAEDSVVQRLECGPTIPPGAEPPSVTILELRGSDPVIEHGDTLIARYRVEGGGPLWTSVIRFSGAFQTLDVVYEELALAQERVVRAVVPRDAVLGKPMALTIMVIDVGDRVDSAIVTTDLVVVDVTPPSVTKVVAFPGQYHVGTPMRITAVASDDRGLAHLIWEFGAPVSVRDSIPIGYTDNWIEPVVLPDWAGKDATLRVWVRDHGNNYSAPWSSATDAFRFHALLAAPAFTSGSLATTNDVVYDAPRQRIYAVDSYRARLRAFSIASMSEIGTIPLPTWPGAADLTVSGDSLLITQSELRALSVVDLNTLTLIDTIALPSVDSIALVDANPPLPTGIRVLANGKAIVKLHREPVGGFNTVEVTLQSGMSRLRTESVGGHGWVDKWWDRMGVTANRSHLLIFDPGCARSYSSIGDSFSGCAIPDPGDLQGTRISSDAASTRVMIGGRVFTPDLTPVATIPYAVTHILPDGLFALAGTPDALFMIRLSDGRIMSRMATRFWPTRLILLEDGHTLLVLDSLGEYVAKLDIASMLP
jgi:hypothetical protein